MASTSALGNLVRLEPLPTSVLPLHPLLGEDGKTISNTVVDAGGSTNPNDTSKPSPQPSPSRPALHTFVKEILDQAHTFVGELPQTFKPGKEKSAKPATSRVSIYTRQVTSTELSDISWGTAKIYRPAPERISGGEAWFARQSRHADHSEEGTADFSEFENGLRLNHSEHEMDFTPSVYDAYRVLDWDDDCTTLGTIEGDYNSISMRIYEMVHKIPAPFSPRAFPVLVVSAKFSRSGFLVVSVPIDISSLPQAMYSNKRNQTEGKYTAVEKVHVLPDQNIEWVMATASDAKGWLPMWMQKLGIPGAIVKDVGLFMSWVTSRRRTTPA